MEKLFNFIQSLPKPVQIMGAVALLAFLGFGVVKFAFGDKMGGKEEDTQRQSVVLDFPDGAEEKNSLSKLEELRRSEGKGSSVDQYWNSLGRDGTDKEGGLMPDSNSGSSGKDKEFYYKGQYLDPAVYSELERYYITHGVKTKEEVDRDHDEMRRIDENNRKIREEYEKTLKEDSDSAYFARMERAYQIARKYTAEPDSPVPAEEKPAEPEPRKIEVQNNSIPSTSLAEDQIITSLESSPLVGGTNTSDGGTVVVPAKATFLKTESLVTGQRVIMRLMQDLKLSDGTVIPSNTHVSGTCKIGSRLNIQIKTINYGGHIYYCNLDIYDNDGTEGIYCPVIVQDKASKSAKKVGNKVGQTAANVLSGIASVANPYVANVSRSTVTEIVQNVDGDGNISVAVSSGYEFYIFETVDRKKKK